MPPPYVNSVKDWFFFVACGMCMGAADLVPGISGGTMAFILGFYENLITNVKNINRKTLLLLCRFKFSELSQFISFKFLAALALGLVIAVVSLAQIIHFLLNNEIYRTYLYSAFTGLILASLIFCTKQVKNWCEKSCFALVLGAVVAFATTQHSVSPAKNKNLYTVILDQPVEADKPINNYDPITRSLLKVDTLTLSAMLTKEVITPEAVVINSQTNERGAAKDFVGKMSYSYLDIWIICCGAIAVSAMLLPGISGSYLLAILGVYPSVIAAVADTVSGASHFHVDIDSIVLLANLFVGIVIGAGVFSRIISWLFTHYHSITIALLVGFMVGALPTVWPFWSYKYELFPLKLEKGGRLIAEAPVIPDWYSHEFFLSSLIMFSSFVLVYLIEKIASTPVARTAN